MVTVLYNVRADSIQLADADWKALLALAKDHGWEPRGTQAPPAPIGSPERECDHSSWDGRYDDAAGQMVRRDDAGRFGEALRKAEIEGAVSPLDDVAKLISWTVDGSFLICRNSLYQAVVPNTPDQLSALGSSLKGFGAGTAVEVDSEASVEPAVRPSYSRAE